jgi:imidazolonepropionase-like amidohydrolase
MKTFASILAVLLTLLLVVGCGGSTPTAVTMATDSPRPTDTPVPPTATTPPTATPLPTETPLPPTITSFPTRTAAPIETPPPVPVRERQGQVIAFTHVNLVPMTEEIVLEGQTVLISGTVIVQVGPADEVAIPQDALVIDGAGAYLMPGLADMHIHTRDDWLAHSSAGGSAPADEWAVFPLNLFLANGVTTIRDFGPGGQDLKYVLRWRDDIHAGTMDGPTIYASGRMLYASPMEYPAGAVEWNHAQGFDFQKLYSYLSKEDFDEGMAAAKELGMYTAGHIPFAVGLEGVLAAGMDEIAHIEELDYEFIQFDRTADLPEQEWIPYILGAALQQYDISQGFDAEDFRSRSGETIAATIDRLQTAQVAVCTTLHVGEAIVQKLFEPRAFEARPENSYLPQRYMDALRAGRDRHQQEYKGVEALATFQHGLHRFMLVELHRAGVLLLLSTDGGTGKMGIVPGFSIHDELRILAENGFTPYEALATGTVNAATAVQRMTGEGDFGTIEVGKRADLILLGRDPLQDVAHVRDPLGVMAAGRWYPQDLLEEMIAIHD